MRKSLVILISLLASGPCFAQSYQSDPDHVTSQIQLEVLDGDSLGIADAITLRPLMTLALNMIKDFEQWRPDPYNDASEYCTVGFGHLIAKLPCASVQEKLSAFVLPLSETAGVELLTGDTALAQDAVRRLVTEPLNSAQFGALVSFTFNVGAGNFADSTMLEMLNAGSFEAASKQFERWNMSDGVILNGLINRRACEAQLFLGQMEINEDETFDRARCAALGGASSTEDFIDIQVGE